MVPFYLRPLTLMFAIGVVTSANGQGPPQSAPPPRVSTEAPGTLTGKERLGRKWTDEQRIDNCNVPIDKRGPKPRPSACGREAGS
jgi:hypothetical protein